MTQLIAGQNLYRVEYMVTEIIATRLVVCDNLGQIESLMSDYDAELISIHVVDTDISMAIVEKDCT